MMEENFETPQINIVERANQRLQQGFKIDFEHFFDRAWQMFKKVWWQILIGYIMIRAVQEIGSRIITPLFMPEMNVDPEQFINGSSVNWREIINWFTKLQSSPMLHLAVLITSTIAVVVSAPLQAGFLKMCREADVDDGTDIGSLFSYFKGAVAGRVLVAGLIVVLITSVLGFILSYIPIAGTILGIGVNLFLFVLFIFVTPLIIFGNAGITDAFKLSCRLALAKFFPIVGFIFLSYLLMLAGLIGCCIGILVTQAFLWIGVYHIYKDAVGFPEDEIEKEQQGHWQDQPPIL
jgi:hypothetical protein